MKRAALLLGCVLALGGCSHARTEPAPRCTELDAGSPVDPVLLAILSSPRHESTPDLRAFALAQSRSTAPLFQADSAGAASSRIDRIASARSRDLRDNRYALWGVR